MDFGTPALVREIPDCLCSRLPLRLYTTHDEHGYRWHLGFPKDLVAPLCPLLECEPYWGNASWDSDGEFKLYWLSVVTADQAIPWDRIKKDLDFHIRMYNMCLRFFRKGKPSAISPQRSAKAS